MVTLVTRAGKGSPLTNAEMDANFNNLNNGKLETAGGNITGALGVATTTANAGIDIGPPGTSGTPFVDFHSSGAAALDYDVRLIAAGGSAAGNGAGTLYIYSGATVFGAAAGAAQMSADATATYLYGPKTFNLGTTSAQPINFVVNSAIVGSVNGAGRWVLNGAADDGSSILQVSGNVKVSGSTYLGTQAGSLYASGDSGQGWVYGALNAFFGSQGVGKTANIVTNGSVRLAASDAAVDVGVVLNANSSLRIKYPTVATPVSAIVDAQTNQDAYFGWSRNGTIRWVLDQGGGDNNLYFNRYNSSGANIDSPLFINSSNGDVNINDRLLLVGVGGVERARMSGLVSNVAGFVAQQGSLGSSCPAFYFVNASSTNVGGIYVGDSATSYVTSSDYRLKRNYAPIQDALSSVMRMAFYTGEFIAAPGQLVDYAIAHELQALMPFAVNGEKDAMGDWYPVYRDGYDPANVQPGDVIDIKQAIVPQGVDYSKLVPRLGAAIQQLCRELGAARDRIARIEGVA